MVTTAKTKDDDLAKLAKLIRGIGFAMFTTALPDGTLHSRPMATQDVDEFAFDGQLWFFTGLHSAKARELKDDQHVNLAYSDTSGNRYVSVAGTASVVRDRAKAKEFWSELYKAWFPKGLDDPELALIRVDVASAEYWDAPSSKMVQLYAYAKAMVTGTPPKDVGDHKTIDLKGKRARPRARGSRG